MYWRRVRHSRRPSLSGDLFRNPRGYCPHSSSADRRAQLQPLKKAIRQLEAKMEKGQEALNALQAQLADGDLFTQSAGEELAELLKQEGQLKRELEDIESDWLAKQEELEVLEAGAA